MIHRRSQLIARALRDVRAEDHAEAVVLDGPAHHVFAPPPHVFTGRDKTGQSLASGRATQEQRSGAVAKQRGGDEVLDAVVGVAAIDGAQLDNEEQHIALGQRLRHPSRARKAAHTTRAAKTENGQPLDRGGKAQTIGEDCIEARDGKPRGGHRHDGFDVIWIDACTVDAFPAHAFQEIGRSSPGTRGCVPPSRATRSAIPKVRMNGVS